MKIDWHLRSINYTGPVLEPEERLLHNGTKWFIVVNIEGNDIDGWLFIGDKKTKKEYRVNIEAPDLVKYTPFVRRDLSPYIRKKIDHFFRMRRLL